MPPIIKLVKEPCIITNHNESLLSQVLAVAHGPHICNNELHICNTVLGHGVPMFVFSTVASESRAALDGWPATKNSKALTNEKSLNARTLKPEV